MKFDDIKAHEIVRIKLTGERIYITNKGMDGTSCWVSGKRQIHTHESGDLFVVESWEPDELQTEEEYGKEHAKERSELLDALRSQGVMILNDLGDMKTERDPHAN